MSRSLSENPSERRQLLRSISCPHCLHEFPPEEILWVSVHSDLRGDSRLDPPGSPPFAFFRFLPSRFDLNGNAIDARGQTCHDLACPRCHLIIPWPLIDTPCLFFAIFGSPGSGKSFLLASMAWTLRQTLHKQFGIDFGDADPVSNATLNQYEESLFFRHNPEKEVPVRDLIRKTQYTESNMFDSVYFGNQECKYPKPFLFELKPAANHPAGNDWPGSRIVCLYDTAGESFQAVSDDNDRLQTTAYLAKARALIFLFDPMQDPRFVAACRKAKGPGAEPGVSTASRQDTILRETAARVRRLLKLNQGALHDRPLLVVVNKWDYWRELLPELAPESKPLTKRKDRPVFSIDMDKIDYASSVTRALLLSHCPEIVSSAESFCSRVIYIPASALGKTPTPCQDFIDPATGVPLPSIKPSDIAPWWTDLPLAYVISRDSKELIESVRRPNPART